MTDIEEPEEELEPSADTKPARASDAKARAATGEEELPYIDDRTSKVWVLAIVGVFVLILVYGLLFGRAGMLTPATPSPSPSPTPAPTLSATPRPSTSASPSTSGSPLVTATPAVTPTPAPSVTATPAPSITPTPAASST